MTATTEKIEPEQTGAGGPTNASLRRSAAMAEKRLKMSEQTLNEKNVQLSIFEQQVEAIQDFARSYNRWPGDTMPDGLAEVLGYKPGQAQSQKTLDLLKATRERLIDERNRGFTATSLGSQALLKCKKKKQSSNKKWNIMKDYKRNTE